MRVHLGSDHAGLELKEHLLNWLADHGYEAVDHGPFVYDALDDYPVFCLRAAEAVADEDGQPRRGHRRLRQRRADRGEQGQGRARALVWSEETAVLAREHNDANVVSVGGRMHSLEDMTRFVEVFLATAFTGEERHTRRIEMLADYEKTGNLPPLPDSALGHQPGQPTCLRATPCFRLARTLDDHFADRVVAVSSPQGRFAESAALLDGTRLVRAESYGKHLFVDFDHERLRARAPRPLRQVRRSSTASRRRRSGRSGCGSRRPGPTVAGRRTATCAVPPRAS